MSRKAEFYRLLDELNHSPEPWAAATLDRLIAELDPIVGACEQGDEERAQALIADLKGRALLHLALPWWGWRG